MIKYNLKPNNDKRKSNLKRHHSTAAQVTSSTIKRDFLIALLSAWNHSRDKINGRYESSF
jgi:hypothetical protein